MIIAFISTTLGLGGTENWVELAARELSRRGHQVVVVAEHAPFDRAERIASDGPRVFCFDSPQAMDVYARLFLSEGVQLVHLHVWERATELIGLKALTGLPILRSYHATLNHRLPGWLWRAIMVARRRGAFLREWRASNRHLDAHVGCCQTSAESIIRMFGKGHRGRIFGLNNGIPLPLENAASVLDGPARFLQVGSLTLRKRPDLTLRAFSRLSKKISDSSLVFVGDGPLESSMRQFAKIRPWLNITFAGSQTDVAPFYARANILVLPSRAEGLPYALLEGAGHGLALIATDRGGMAELVQPGQSGLLVEPDSERSLSEAMTLLACDPEQRTALGHGARDLVARSFLLDGHVDQLLRIYAQVAPSAC